jgi:hypothetical protein
MDEIPDLVPADAAAHDAPSSHRDVSNELPDARKVPITIVTGFLGAGTRSLAAQSMRFTGKTTLLQHILTAKQVASILRHNIVQARQKQDENVFGASNRSSHERHK